MISPRCPGSSPDTVVATVPLDTGSPVIFMTLLFTLWDGGTCAGRTFGTVPVASSASAAVASTKPVPWSCGPDPSPRSPGLADEMMALVTCTAVAPGYFWRRTAAIPATLGELKLVPPAKPTVVTPPESPWP